MPILHLIRDPGEQVGLALARQQAEVDEVAVVLIQEGVRMTPPADLSTLALAEDVQARGLSVALRLIDMPALVRLLEAHDRVWVW